MTGQATIAPSRHSVSVPLLPERAFALFVDEFDSWWPKGSHTAGDAQGVVLEPNDDGRWGELDPEGRFAPWGRVLSLQRPTRILLAWQLDPDFKFDPDPAHGTEVEVTFEPEHGGTRVTLEHRGFEIWGERGAGMRDSVDAEGGWAELIRLYEEHAQR